MMRRGESTEEDDVTDAAQRKQEKFSVQKHEISGNSTIRALEKCCLKGAYDETNVTLNIAWSSPPLQLTKSEQ